MVAVRPTLLHLVLASTAFVTGCAERNTYVAPPPPEVIVANPITRDVTRYLTATGTAYPQQVVEIRARVRGFLQERPVTEGSLVKKGELLIVIDEEPFQVQLDQARARLEEAEAVLKKAQESQIREVTRAQVALDESQLELARQEEERLKRLVASRAVTAEDIDRVVAERVKNEAQVESTRASLKQAEADYNSNILSAQANVSAAKTAVRDAEINLSYCRITSPLDGRIGRFHYDVGNLVGDGQASLLTTVVKLDPIYVYTNLSVEDFQAFRLASHESESDAGPRQVEMDVALASESDFPHRGHIDYYDPQVNMDTGTVEVRGVFPNADGVIMPGAFARVRVPLTVERGAKLVPEKALATDQLGQYLLVVGADDKVERRAVEVGPLEGDLRVVEGAIALADRVIVEGLMRARAGVKVSPKVEAATRVADGSGHGVRVARAADETNAAGNAD